MSFLSTRGQSINASFNSNTLGSLITTGGNIGIGTTSPNYILDVNGNVNFSGNLYQSGSLMQTSFKNRIINGAMMIDQRNTGGSKTITAGAAAVYTIDRWYVSCSGANVTTQRVTGSNGNMNAFRITGAASNTGTVFGQAIESVNSYDLVNQSVTVGLRVSSTSITSLTWRAYYANTTDTFSSKTQISTGTLTINSTDAAYSFTFNAGSSAANGISVEFSTGALLAAQTITYQQIQLEFGTQATAFERRSYSLELMLCYRYYTYVNLLDGFYDTNYWKIFPHNGITVPMRVTPTLDRTAYIKSPSNGNDLGTPSINGISNLPSVLYVSSTSNPAGGNWVELYGFGWVAEL